ncbi:MAG: serine hydrolase [Fidelibacterota bacterium]|jgi:D-alanyl-D-alanine dipeptidase/CubicO group peptidase (beta-lactamase class C family)|tara:strand:+ start:976 stop:3327 length:2352 start_codon:yes stop_codon:yes gene_type:complete
MIKFTSKLLYIFASIIVSIQGCDNNPQNIDPIKGFELVALKLENAINYEIKSKNLNAISMVLVDDQKIAWAKGFGYENPDSKINADANTVYRVGSVSKLFTDMAIMQRVEIGEIDLDKAIQTYLPNFKPDNPYKKPITLRQMMSHRSGLLREPRKGNYFTDDEISLKTTVESIIPSKLIHEPESKTKYSNAAIAVVGYTLESLYKTPYVDYMQKHILEKIGMNNSAFAPNTKIRARLAKATMWSYDDRIFSAPTFELGMIPAGSLYAPVTDLAKFMMVLFAQGKGPKEVVIKPETLNKMISPQFGGDKTRGYGIGFGLSEHGGYQKIGHGGAIYGFSTQLYAIPEIKYGVATSSSVDISNSITTKLSNYALDLMLANKNNEPLPDYIKTSQLDAKISQSLKGHYSRGNLYADIELRGPSTVLVINSLEVPLKQSSKGIISDGRIDQGSFKIQKSGEDILVNGKLFTKKVKRKKTQFPNEWKGLVGEYGWDHNILFVYEDMGSLWLLMEWIEKNQLLQVKDDLFAFPENSRMYYGERLKFKRNAAGVATEVAIINGPVFKRREIGASNSETFRIEPLKPIEELRDIAFKAKPPKENQDFLSSDLVELKNIDKTINYDIRYASTNNFMSNKFYTRAEAYLQRPAAQALGRVNKKLKTKGYGLLIHDAYRPWYVTKMFWDATPLDKKIFVANPENGSRHNRGCAIDLTLYDLKSGKVIEMVGGYDEMTERSYPNYYGGTTEQRWHRKLLREVMESEGFNVYEFEWWHFDYKDWKQYPISNDRFEDL